MRWNTFTLWIGASDLKQTGRFTWQATGKQINYSKWGEKNPDNYKGNEHCVQLRVFEKGKTAKMWNDGNCESKFPYACENKNFAK